MLREILTEVTFWGSWFAVLQGVGQLSIRKKNAAHYYYAGIYLCLAMLLLATWNIDANVKYRYPSLSYVDIPFLYLIGVFIYLWLRQIQGAGVQRKTPVWLHFVAPAASLAALLPFYMLEPATKATHLHEVFVGRQVFFTEYIFAIGLISVIIYCWVGLRNIRAIWNISIFKAEKSVQLISYIVLVTLLAIIVAMAGVLSRELLFIRISTALATVALCLKFVIGHRYPQFNQSLTTVVHQAQKHSYIKDLNLKALEKQILDLMQNRRLYRDEELSLSSLASELGITIHQMSQFLNEHLHKNFSRFVNEYRISEARELLLSQSDTTILKIAHEVGFSSQTSFHRAFLNMVGCTPSQYRSDNRPA